MDTNMLIRLKNTPEMIADQHDGSYELMRAIIGEYKGVENSILDFNDLNAVYLMSVGTWKHGVDAKKKIIDNSHLRIESKSYLKKLLDEIHKKSTNGAYSIHGSSERGLFGMFGTGFNTFKDKTNEKSVRSFIQMCIDISEMTSDQEIYLRAGQVLTSSFKGMKAASASMVLHCLKPYTFPILNSNMGSDDIFAALDIKLKKKGDLDTYIENCKAIKAFRDNNLPFKNYRILDIAAWNVGEDPLTEIIKQYKVEFDKFEKEERYKWEAIKCFQDNWDINANDFSEMLKKSLSKTSIMLSTGKVFARAMIEYLSEKDPEKVREMFKNLYDESTDIIERIEAFVEDADILFKKYKDPHNSQMNQHYQRTSIISIYLFLRFPEYYYMYQYGKYKSFAGKIDYEAQIIKGHNQNILGYMDMCDKVLDIVKKDNSLIIMNQQRLDENCYQDSALHMLVDDIVYFGSKALVTNEANDEEDEVKEPLETFCKNMILCGPPGTGKTYHTINYAVAIIEDKPLASVTAESYSNVLDRYNNYKEAGYVDFTTFHQSYGYEEFIEGIKPELNSNEDDSDETRISYKIADGIFKEFCTRALTPVIKKNNNYGFSEYPTVWKVSLAGTGDNPVRKYCMDKGCIRIGWDEYGPVLTDETVFNLGGKNVLNAFIYGMKIGDIVLSCFSERTIDGIGVITGDYEWHDELGDYCRVRTVKWLLKGIDHDIYELNHNKVMTLATIYKMGILVSDIVDILNKKLDGGTPSIESPKKYVFIIDEINRGNISKIFGELITLIETTKRLGQPEAMKAKLPYSKDLFGVPDNVYIIGTMNTADRSIALIDTALRRRFDFIETMPDTNILSKVVIEGVSIASMLETINKRIEVLSDRDHLIGHAYFIDLISEPTLVRLSGIFAQNIIPLLQEYFYEDYEKIRLVLGDTHKEPEEQFILVKQIDYAKLFGVATFELDEVPAYTINHAALLNINAYKKI